MDREHLQAVATFNDRANKLRSATDQLDRGEGIEHRIGRTRAPESTTIMAKLIIAPDVRHDLLDIWDYIALDINHHGTRGTAYGSFRT